MAGQRADNGHEVKGPGSATYGGPREIRNLCLFVCISGKRRRNSFGCLHFLLFKTSPGFRAAVRDAPTTGVFASEAMVLEAGPSRVGAAKKLLSGNGAAHRRTSPSGWRTREFSVAQSNVA
jgi:hypothetical protein